MVINSKGAGGTACATLQSALNGALWIFDMTSIGKIKYYARDQILEGRLSYELAMSGPEYALEEFVRVFSAHLELAYPVTNIEGIYVRPGENAIHIVSFKGKEPTHHDREAIIDFIHEMLGENLWHGSWRTAIGRS